MVPTYLELLCAILASLLFKFLSHGNVPINIILSILVFELFSTRELFFYYLRFCRLYYSGTRDEKKSFSKKKFIEILKQRE